MSYSPIFANLHIAGINLLNPFMGILSAPHLETIPIPRFMVIAALLPFLLIAGLAGYLAVSLMNDKKKGSAVLVVLAALLIEFLFAMLVFGVAFPAFNYVPNDGSVIDMAITAAKMTIYNLWTWFFGS